MAFLSRSPQFPDRVRTLFVEQPSRAGAAPERSIAKRPDGTCVFRENRRCTIHATGGEAALPIGCRHYPRVVRIDNAGIALSLSHYCPTAASLLISDEPVRIVMAEPPLSLSDPIEGLDARAALPPLLRRDLLMDHEAYAAWERTVVDLFARDRAGTALRRIAAGSDRLREWRPGRSSLTEAVADAFAADHSPAEPWFAQGVAIARNLNRGIVSIPASAEPRPLDRSSERILGNYLAARAFGNWIAYQGRGLRTIVTWLAACHDIVRALASSTPAAGAAAVMEAVRHTDYVMLHTIDTQAFADAARGLEA